MLAALNLFILFLQQDSASGFPELNAPICQDASRSFLITVLTIDLVVVIACVALKWFWNKRLVSFRTSFIVPLILAFVISSGLVAWNPLKTETLISCLESEEFSRYVIMAHVAAVPRGLVLGGLVSVGLYLLILLIIGLLPKKRG
jgi:uncharacterized membrane protein